MSNNNEREVVRVNIRKDNDNNYLTKEEKNLIKNKQLKTFR